MMNPQKIFENILAGLPPSSFENSYSFHDAFEDALKRLGWCVTREFQVQDRGDGRTGYIDLAVTDPVQIGIELDRNSPRKYSLFKLAQFKGLRFIVLRGRKRVICV
jgi:hypothetical protein